jgi:hypothetical protein
MKAQMPDVRVAGIMTLLLAKPLLYPNNGHQPVVSMLIAFDL